MFARGLPMNPLNGATHPVRPPLDPEESGDAAYRPQRKEPLMKRRLVLALVGFALLLAVQASGQVIVIANPSIKASELSKASLQEVFTGSASTLKDGSRASPILLSGGPAHEEFLKAYIGKSDAAYRASWRSLVFSGQASMPKSMDGDAAMVDFVTAHPGAIGYIAKTSPHAGVKVLVVQ